MLPFKYCIMFIFFVINELASTTLETTTIIIGFSVAIIADIDRNETIVDIKLITLLAVLSGWINVPRTLVRKV